MRYYKGYIVLSDARDVPLLLHIRNARAVTFNQLCALVSFDEIEESIRSLRWRVARLEKGGLIARMDKLIAFGKPVFTITQSGLMFLESRGHYLLSLPSTAEQILHPSQVPHALELVDIRIALATGGILRSWKCELEIASRNLVLENAAVKDYDAIAEIDVDGSMQTVAIEYERSPKAAARYRDIRAILDRDESTDTVLYLAGSDDVLYLLAVELRSARKRIGFALSESFRHSLLDTRTLMNTSGSDIVPFRNLFASS
jgi:hypothetical protein